MNRTLLIAGVGAFLVGTVVTLTGVFLDRPLFDGGRISFQVIAPFTQEERREGLRKSCQEQPDNYHRGHDGLPPGSDADQLERERYESARRVVEGD
jgi:hypothetical protein